MKIVKAVHPYIHPHSINFKYAPFEAWNFIGGKVVKGYYPSKFLHGFIFRYELPNLKWLDKMAQKLNVSKSKEARLCFVEPISINLDTFPYYMTHEIIPFFWDCWPCYFDRIFLWLKKYNIKTAIFTSSQFVEMVKEKFPEMNVMWCHEGIDVDKYKQGVELKERKLDFLEYGRNIDHVVKYSFDKMRILRGQRNGCNCLSDEELLNAMQNSRIVAAFPKSYTHPLLAGNIETLTQRFWECMLSRMVLVGHAPKELIDIVGYNPVIEIDLSAPDEQLNNIIKNIEDYQELVDRNRVVALKMAPWTERMRDVMEWLTSLGYSC